MQSIYKSQYFTLTNILVVLTAVNYFISSTGAYGSPNLLMMYFVDNPNFRVWQPLSHIFMHGSVNHLLFNMFGLWMFGQVLEKVWGAKRFLFFYLACGIGAALIYSIVQSIQLNGLIETVTAQGVSREELYSLMSTGQDWSAIPVLGEAAGIFNTRMVGASGAIYGVLVAFAFLFPNHKLMLIFLPVPIAAKFFVPAILLLDLFSGVTKISIFGGNVAHFAHIGGATIGLVLTLLWFQRVKQQRHRPMGVWRE
ncbi:MAG: rhomboid family intramembrane serine protease [Gammaproteobacteria bacterium]|nr:rhomboid family intramembrane serine protease [Gammaproteobacteria bacterium]